MKLPLLRRGEFEGAFHPCVVSADGGAALVNKGFRTRHQAREGANHPRPAGLRRAAVHSHLGEQWLGTPTQHRSNGWAHPRSTAATDWCSTSTDTWGPRLARQVQNADTEQSHPSPLPGWFARPRK